MKTTLGNIIYKIKFFKAKSFIKTIFTSYKYSIPIEIMMYDGFIVIVSKDNTLLALNNHLCEQSKTFNFNIYIKFKILFKI